MNTSASSSALFSAPGAANAAAGAAGQPPWFQNPKKRVIPNHFVPKRKSGFQIAQTAGKKDPKKSDFFDSAAPFNLLSFGAQRKPALDAKASFYDTTETRYDETVKTDEFSLYDDDGDAPPARSMYDLNDEILLALDKPNPYNESFIHQDPKSYGNVFNRDAVAVAEDVPKPIHPLQNGESAILVFGYPEHMANQVIQHFQEFGTVLEDFQSAQGSFSAFSAPRRTKIVPCFSGKSWVKLTFDNPASALDSLQENGAIFNGVLLGVVPYTKDAIEKLQNRKLADSEDIGGGVDLISADTPHKVDTAVVGDANDMQASYVSRLDIKDGSDMLLKSGAVDQPNVEQKQNTQKLGVVDTALKYVFGFNEL